MSYKYNQKSVRLTDEVLDYINSYPDGDSFNQKLENIVLFVYKNEADIKKRIDFLNSEFDKKREELNKINSEIVRLKDIERKLEILVNSVDLFVEGVGR